MQFPLEYVLNADVLMMFFSIFDKDTNLHQEVAPVQHMLLMEVPRETGTGYGCTQQGV